MFAVYLDESGTHKGTDALSVGGYIATIKQWGELARSWEFVDKRDVVQLQAADVIAYETWKQMENRVIAGERRPMRKSLFNLLRQSGGTPHISNYFNEENLSELETICESRTIS